MAIRSIRWSVATRFSCPAANDSGSSAAPAQGLESCSETGRHSGDGPNSSSGLAETCGLLASVNFMLRCRLIGFGPSPARDRLLWPLLTSAHPSARLAASVATRADVQISQNKACRFRSVQAGSTAGAPDEILGVSVHCRLSRPVGLLSGFCSSCPSFVSGFLQTLPRGNALAFDFLILFHLGSLETFIPATCHV